MGLILAALLLSGCTTASQELSREEARRQAAWDALVSHRPAVATLGWADSLERMRKHNAKLLSANQDISRAVEALDQVKRSLIPTVSFSAGYEKFFESGGATAFNPFSFAANVFFDVPGLFNYRVRYEAAILTLQHARLVRETVWRDQVLALYRATIEGKDLQDRAARLEKRRAAVGSLADTAPDTAAKERGALAADQRDLRKAQEDWLHRTGEILGMTGTPLVLSGEGLPPLPYGLAADRPNPEKLAQLPLRLAALDLLALRARKLGITLQEWPEIEMNVDSPTVYESGAGQSYVWSPREVFVGVTSYWTLDTQGKHASDRRLLDGEMAYRREVLEQEAADTAGKLRRALDGLAETDMRLWLVNRALASSQGSLDRELRDARESLLADRREWSLTIWFFDDAMWNAALKDES